MVGDQSVIENKNDHSGIGSVLGLIWKTHAGRYYHITMWGLALSVVTGWKIAAIWYAVTITGGLLRSVMEKRMQNPGHSGNVPFSSHWTYPVTVIFVNSFWAVAPYLAWSSGHQYGPMLTAFLLASGYLLVISQFRGLPKYIALFSSPYSAVILYLLVTEAGAPIYWPLIMGLAVLFSAIHFAIVYGSLAQKQIIEGQEAQDTLIGELEEARDAAESANNAKSAFLAMISHELRTPMNGVLGAARLLAKSDMDRDQKDHLYILEASSSSLMSLLNDVLDFSKIEAGRLTIEAIEVDIKALFERLAGTWRGVALEKGLEFKAVIPDNLPDLIMSDPTRISQILHNLLSNAVKFTSEGSVRFEIFVTAQDDRTIDFMVKVKDTGLGIRQEDIKRLFQPFEQLDVSRTRTHGGTGLGLAIAQKLAKNMGGDIRVESEEGQGSVFSVTLRAEIGNMVMNRDKDVATQCADAIVTAPKKILVVEDHPLNCKLIESFLIPLGHKLTIANNGAQALEILQDDSFDLILMDVHMPKMDGLEATRRIRCGDTQNAKRPIIMLSAGAMAEERNEGMKAGADAYVTKPIDPEELAAAIEQFAGEKAPEKSEAIEYSI